MTIIRITSVINKFLYMKKISYFLFLISCNKEYEFTKDRNSSLIIRNNSGSGVSAAATRKLKIIEVTDAETGKKNTYYDCTETGSSCDVGEKAGSGQRIFTSGSNSALNVNNTALNYYRIQFIEQIANKTASNLRTLFIANQVDSLFPYIYDSLNFQKLINNEIILSYHSKRLFVEINNAPEKCYDMNSFMTDEDIISFLSKDSTKVGVVTKKAEYDTESGIMKCINEGSNCTVSKPTTLLEIDPSMLYSYANYLFPEANLKSKIQSGDYYISSSDVNFYRFIPIDTNKQTYYYKK